MVRWVWRSGDSCPKACAPHHCAVCLRPQKDLAPPPPLESAPYYLFSYWCWLSCTKSPFLLSCSSQGLSLHHAVWTSLHFLLPPRPQEQTSLHPSLPRLPGHKAPVCPLSSSVLLPQEACLVHRERTGFLAKDTRNKPHLLPRPPAITPVSGNNS